MASDGNVIVAPTEENGTAAPPFGTHSLKIYAGADSFGCNLKGALVAYLRSLPGVEVVDLGTDKYYSIAEQVGRHVSSSASGGSSPETRGLLSCGTGVGVSMFANKFSRVYAATCSSAGDAVNARSINACNVLAVSGMNTSPDDAMAAIPNPSSAASTCAICCLRNGIKFEPVGIMPGGEMKIVRESPTSAIVRFKAGSVEPAHHHTFGHDLVVMKGKKKVWNLTKKESYDLEDGDFLFTPAWDVHRLQLFYSFQHMPVENKRLFGKPTGGFNKRNMLGILIYMAAEFLRNNIHTEKSDVYGFSHNIYKAYPHNYVRLNRQTCGEAHTALKMSYIKQLTSVVVSNRLRPTLADLNLVLQYYFLNEGSWHQNCPDRPLLSDIVKEYFLLEHCQDLYEAVIIMQVL
ncbi:unnamed protein product, partial [Musa textilis]